MSDKLQKTNNKNDLSISKIDLSKINTSALAAGLTKLTIPRLFYQLVVFVMDGSGSMTFEGNTGRSKGEELSKSLIDSLERLKNSKNKNCFDISLWAYANESVNVISKIGVRDIDLTRDYNPCNFITHNNSTMLSETMGSVKTECLDYLKENEDKNAQAIIIILSDGVVYDYTETIQRCNELKLNKKITISSIFFESINWQDDFNEDDLDDYKDGFKTLASDESLFTSTLDPEEIRKHMIKSISTVSKID